MLPLKTCQFADCAQYESREQQAKQDRPEVMKHHVIRKVFVEMYGINRVGRNGGDWRDCHGHE